MAKLRLPIRELQAKLDRTARKTQASVFEPELKRFAGKVFSDCVKPTPVRSVSRIRKAQRKQYQNRVDYIPSVHTVSDPTLIVKPNGEHWLFTRGKWFKASEWKMPAGVFATYQQLLSERKRRLKTARPRFVESRAQARFLYQRSWTQCGDSINVPVLATNDVRNARTRRKPAKEPPRAHAQIRGGKQTISIAVFNPFLEMKSRYKPFSGKDILAKAIERNRGAFMAECRAKAQKLTKAA